MKKVPFLLVVAIIMTLPFSVFAVQQTLPEAVEAYLGTRTCNTYFVEDGAAVVVTVVTAGKPAELKWNSTGKTIRGLMEEYLQGFTKKVEVEIRKIKIYPAPKDGKIQPGYELESANTSVVENNKSDGDLQPIRAVKHPGGEWNFPDSLEQRNIKDNVWLKFNWFSTQISSAASFTWDIVKMIFSGIFLFLAGAMFFFRFIASAVASEGPVKMYGLGIVSINARMLRIFGWSSFLTFCIAIIMMAVFVITTFLWVCAFGWPVWLTAISFWPISVFGKEIVNWATPDLKDETASLLGMGGGDVAHHG